MGPNTLSPPCNPRCSAVSPPRPLSGEFLVLVSWMRMCWFEWARRELHAFISFLRRQIDVFLLRGLDLLKPSVSPSMANPSDVGCAFLARKGWRCICSKQPRIRAASQFFVSMRHCRLVCQRRLFSIGCIEMWLSRIIVCFVIPVSMTYSVYDEESACIRRVINYFLKRNYLCVCRLIT